MAMDFATFQTTVETLCGGSGNLTSKQWADQLCAAVKTLIQSATVTVPATGLTCASTPGPVAGSATGTIS